MKKVIIAGMLMWLMAALGSDCAAQAASLSKDEMAKSESKLYSKSELALIDRNGKVVVPVDVPEPTADDIRVAYMRHCTSGGQGRIIKNGVFQSLVRTEGRSADEDESITNEFLFKFQVNDPKIKNVEKIENSSGRFKVSYYLSGQRAIADVSDLNLTNSVIDPNVSAKLPSDQDGQATKKQHLTFHMLEDYPLIDELELTESGWKIIVSSKSDAKRSLVEVLPKLGDIKELNPRQLTFVAPPVSNAVDARKIAGIPGDVVQAVEAEIKKIKTGMETPEGQHAFVKEIVGKMVPPMPIKQIADVNGVTEEEAVEKMATLLVPQHLKKLEDLDLENAVYSRESGSVTFPNRIRFQKTGDRWIINWHEGR